MQLHQILRYIPKETPIQLLDIEGLLIGNFKSKLEINVNFYEYEILVMRPYLVRGNTFADSTVYMQILLVK